MLPAANSTLVSDRQQAFLSAASCQRLARSGVRRTRWNRVRLARSRAGWFLVNVGLRLAHPRGDDARVAPDSSFSVAFLARVRS